nr:PREDICTED: uncharacterized protein LOC109036149 isoform X2 [Bemisia tabaci]
MKVLVILSAVLASCLAYPPSIGYAYSAISPLTAYSSFAAPYPYAFGAPAISTAPLAAPIAPIAPIARIAPIAPVAAATKTQYHSQDELGQAKYGHSEPLQAHTAVQDAHGNKIGSFSYVDPHGAVHQTNYVADGAGYRVVSNDLPVAPAAPLPALHRRRRQAHWNGPLASPVVTPTGHLQETPEVVAAKAAHFAEHARQNSASAQQRSWNPAQASAQPSWNSAPAQQWSPPQAVPAQQWTQPWTSGSQEARSGWSQPQAAPVQQWHQAPAQNAPIADAPDVAAAKAAHLSEYTRVQAAAQAAVAQAAASGPQGQEDDGSYRPEYQTEGVPAAPAATPYSSWTQPQPQPQSWSQPQPQSWSQPQAQPWSQPQAAAPVATPYTSWNQPQAQSWSQPQQWGQSPSGGIPDTPEVAAAKAAHLAEHAAASRRSKRSVLLQTPASTAPLAAPLAYAAAPVSYAAAPVAYPAPAVAYPAPAVAYSAPALGVPAIRTDIVHNPGHAFSYRIDALH